MGEMNKDLYVVGVLFRELDLEALNGLEISPLKLSFAEGMFGMCPAFSTLKAAKKFNKAYNGSIVKCKIRSNDD